MANRACFWCLCAIKDCLCLLCLLMTYTHDSDNVDFEMPESSHNNKEVDKDSSCACINDCNSPTGKDIHNGAWVLHAKRTRAVYDESRSCAVLIFTLLMLILCVAAFMFCPRCLFLVLIICACLCPFIHPLNAPLWLAIILLTFSGWSFTTGTLSVSWNSGHINGI